MNITRGQGKETNASRALKLCWHFYVYYGFKENLKVKTLHYIINSDKIMAISEEQEVSADG